MKDSAENKKIFDTLAKVERKKIIFSDNSQGEKSQNANSLAPSAFASKKLKDFEEAKI